MKLFYLFYEVSDISGRIVLDSSIAAGIQDINVLTLIDGNFIISLYKGGALLENDPFVKK